MSDVYAPYFEAFPVWLRTLGEDVEELGPQTVHLTIVAGEHKGLVVSINAAEPIGSFVELIGMPATISVVDGTPTLRIDR